MDFENGRKTSVVLVNAGQDPVKARVFVYDAAGNPLGEVRGEFTLTGGGRTLHSREKEGWPEETASLKVESDGPLLSFLVVESTDGRLLEAALDPSRPAAVLALPVFHGEEAWRSRITVMNAGPASTAPGVIALDGLGRVVGKAELPPLGPMERATFVTNELFDATLLPLVSSVTLVADQPLASLHVLGADDRTDIAVLPSPLDLGQQLVLPLFAEIDGVGLWTMVGLLNPRDGPASLRVDVFDSQGRPLGHLPDRTSLPSRGSQHLLSQNIGGGLPVDAAYVVVTADQTISGYVVVGAVGAQGLSAIRVTGGRDTGSVYGLVGSGDGDALATLSLADTFGAQASSAPHGSTDGSSEQPRGSARRRYQAPAVMDPYQWPAAVERSATEEKGPSEPYMLSAVTRTAGAYIWPLDAPRITQDYACYECVSAGTYTYHAGIDMTSAVSPATATTIVAAQGGTVYRTFKDCVARDTSCGREWGNHIVIRQDDGLYAVYAHLARVDVSASASSMISQGAPIGVMGNTGRSDAAHLHFQLLDHDPGSPGNFTPSQPLSASGMYAYRPSYPTDYGYLDPRDYFASWVVRVNTAVLNVHEKPDRAAPQITEVSDGQEFVAIARSANNWYYIFLPSKVGPNTTPSHLQATYGWFSGAYLLVDPTPTRTQLKVRGKELGGGGLHVRSGANIADEPLTKIWGGQRFVTPENQPGRGCDKNWYKISLPANAGAGASSGWGWSCRNAEGSEYLDVVPDTVPATLSVSLVASLPSGPVPLSTVLTADVSGSAMGPINYTFWWNCNDLGTIVDSVTLVCGNPTDPTIGKKFDGVTDDPKTVTHTYSAVGTYTAKVIAERGAAPPAQQQTTITVSGRACGTTYWFALKTADEVPNWSGVSNSPSRTTAACPDTTAPAT
ncbi:MAG: peptidoglycan DD-metalloendopeptidase family protein, partial [Candidatus Rokubacteria bacterium]|nr:peptidoglycan DD-metalloendopeptidase family protein [Candidatus Rokubacteria bacterium]